MSCPCGFDTSMILHARNDLFVMNSPCYEKNCQSPCHSEPTNKVDERPSEGTPPRHIREPTSTSTESLHVRAVCHLSVPNQLQFSDTPNIRYRDSTGSASLCSLLILSSCSVAWLCAVLPSKVPAHPHLIML